MGRGLGLLLAAAGMLGSAAALAATLPKLYQLPAFKLVDQNGAAVDLPAMKGKAWIADFIFTRCPDECPLMTNKMQTVQRLTAAAPGVAFVSITTDPAYDTPAVLKAYAKQHKVDERNWRFLTGAKPAIVKLSVDGFKLAADEASFAHSGRFVLVDGDGRVRGYYDGATSDELAKLAADAKALAAGG